ncbi:MAG: ABC transporter substrate-binding protein [Pseudonocardiaceae bacterium]
MRNIAALFCLVLALISCGNSEASDRTDVSDGGPASADTEGDKGNGTYTAPPIPSGPPVFVAMDSPYTAYNNTTGHTSSPGNTLVLNQVLTDPFIVDGNGAFLLNSDVLESAELTSQDPQVVTYRIKPNVRWSDGAAWDCDDFYLAWLAGSGKTVVKGPDGEPALDADGAPMSYFEPATTKGYRSASGECRDDNTFVETYAAPYADWRRNYIQNVLLPAHVLERVTGIADITTLGPESSPADLQKAGDAWSSGWLGFHAGTMPASGPYRIDTVVPGGSVVLVRNEEWVGNPGGPERIVFVPIADGSAAVQGLQNQQLTVVAPRQDLIQADPVLADRLRALTDQGVVVEIRGGASTVNLDLNLSRPLFQDAEVRAAFAQCIDRNQLVEELVREVIPAAQPQGSLTFLPGDPNYVDRYVDKMPADSRQAQLTLEEAGWVLGPDGVYSRQEQRLSFAISHSGSPADSRAVKLIRIHCRQAGMEITDGAVPDGMGKALAQGSFDVALTTVSLAPPVRSLVDRYGSNGERNYQSYANPDVDEALGVAQAEYSSSAQTAAMMKADQLITDDLVSFPLFQLPILWSYRSNLDHVFLHSTDGVTWNANEWEAN